jgi:aminoglycoside phosphotransferase (APT) family kinase protein
LKLPDAPNITRDTLQAIADCHGLQVDTFTRLPEVGIFNAIYQLNDDVILRVPRLHPAFVAAAHKEAIAAPAARAIGVRTPLLIAFDPTLTLLPVPYTLYERVRGDTLGLLDLEPNDTPKVWREVGSDLARLHSGIMREGAIADLECEAVPDPRSLPDALAEAGTFSAIEARWLERWLDRLAPLAHTPESECFLHNDVQATNIMVGAVSRDYLAILDWGAAGWGDLAWDFAGMPLRAVPFMLEGYRDAALLAHDNTIEARILWRHLQLALFLLQREPQPGRAWAERPAGMLLEVLRFFHEDPPKPWLEWR